MSSAPVGFFDSGIGGTTIWKEFHQLLPQENTIYLSDSANSPYGTKSQDKITELSFKNTDYLLSKNCKLIVVACNTATANSISILREKYAVPFIGVEPAIKTAVKNQGQVIGVLATKSTIESKHFQHNCRAYPNCQFITQPGGDLVKLIEAGGQNSPEVIELLRKCCQRMLSAKIDSIVLGCSHYPYLTEQLKKILPNDITIIDSGRPVAKQAAAILEQQQLINLDQQPGSCLFYSNNDLTALKKLVGESFSTKILNF